MKITEAEKRTFEDWLYGAGLFGVVWWASRSLELALLALACGLLYEILRELREVYRTLEEISEKPKGA
jgi:hypothetical protein